VALDITPKLLLGRQRIERYGGGGFTVAGQRHLGSVIVFPDRTQPWPVDAADRVTAASLAAAVEVGDAVRILLVGCGTRFEPAPAQLAAAMRGHGIALEWMDTGAACRTFNVLLAEERAVAAALIAVS
jgi:uncharacterized protein